jgi:chromosome segregation ATPase
MALITKEDLSELESNIASTKKTIDSFKTKLGDISGEITAISSDVKKKGDQLTDIGIKIPLTEKIIDDAAAIIAANNAKIADNKALLKDYDTQLAAAESAGNDAEVKRLLQLIDALKVEIDTLAVEIDNQTIASTDAKATLDDLLLSEADIKKEIDTLNNNLVSLNGEYNDIKSEVISLEQELAKLESSTLLKEYEKQVETRKEHAKGTVKNKERIKVLLRDQNETVKDELSEFESDSKIFIDDIKAELEFTTEAETKLERIQSALDGTDSLFTAAQAFNLASESIYSIKEIVEKIKKACYEGKTSIDLKESEVSGTQILMLNKVGYKITHASISNPGRKLDDLIITIDWGFVSEN